MKLKPCPFCGGAIDSKPTGGIFIHHPIDPQNPWACGVGNAAIRVEDWNNRPGEDAARAEALKDAVTAIEERKKYKIKRGDCPECGMNGRLILDEAKAAVRRTLAKGVKSG